MAADKEQTYDAGYARSIDLPQLFRNMKNAKGFIAVDIGGSLAKVAYLSEVNHIRKRHFSFTSSRKSDEEDPDKVGPIYEIKEQQEAGVRLHFVKFETTLIGACVDFIRDNVLSDGGGLGKVLKATGGGAYKYKDLLESKLGMKVDKEDEMQCLIGGCNFLLRNIPQEVFEFHRDKDPQYVFHHLDSTTLFPYLLINIGSGVSVVKVESENKYERIGGTSMGGGTFLGLGSLLTKAKGFDDLLELTSKGHNKNVDMLVKDIYGGAYASINLPGELTASSFGKAARNTQQDREQFSEADIAKSLLHMISNDIAQLAALYANISNVNKIYFSGYFIRGHPVTMHTISFGVNFWSKGTQKALFLRHEGYLGAIGAFLRGLEEDRNISPRNLACVTWGENFAGSSGLQSGRGDVARTSSKELQGVKCDVLELDQMPRPLAVFPLLANPSGYLPDSVDLSADSEARDYWLTCFDEALDKAVERAIASQPDAPDAAERAEKFRNKYRHRLSVLQQQPSAYGALTVRSLLDTREQYMDEFQFSDPYAKVKQQENEAALALLSKRFEELDCMTWGQRQVALVKGMLAGNVFDWGAKEVASLMEEGQLNFGSAMARLQARPWLRDDLDAWIERLQGPSHELVVVFVDNSGVDVILGVFPFVRELLSRGTKVILAANSFPALNDVMYSELIILVERVTELCSQIALACSEDRLVVMQSGIGSPCLDLRRIDAELAAKCQQADLIVVEGMGRAIHTNYEAQFTCESLKLAVIKNRWLARRLNGDMYSVVFRYEKGVDKQ